LVTDDLAQCLPGARPAVVIGGASHVMHLGNPGEYNRVVLDFLAGL
jgi:pimeloyl-ACP methyl ester carboxylesterase